MQAGHHLVCAEGPDHGLRRTDRGIHDALSQHSAPASTAERPACAGVKVNRSWHEARNLKEVPKVLAGLPGRIGSPRRSRVGPGWSWRYDKFVHVLFQFATVRGAVGGIIISDALVSQPEKHVGVQDS